MSAVLSESRREYETWHDRFAVDVDTNTPWHGMVKGYLESARDLDGKRVLEIGCGRGGFACWLASQPRRPREIVAADFASTAVQKGAEFAAGRGLDRISWETQDIQAIGHPDSSFDTVISCETVEHVPDPRQAMREMARVLRPGGRLFLTTPNYFGIYGLYRGYMRLTGRKYTEEGQPINNFMMLPLTRKWIADTGLRVTKVDAVGHYLLYPGRLPRALPAFDDPRFLMRWFGLHSLVIAEKSR